MFPIKFLLLIRGFNYLFTLRYISLFLFVDFFVFLFVSFFPFEFTLSLDLFLSRFVAYRLVFTVLHRMIPHLQWRLLAVIRNIICFCLFWNRCVFFLSNIRLFDFECVLICVVYACVEMCVSLSLSFMAAWYYYTGEA